jgi:carbohydrate-selective porin OprB
MKNSYKTQAARLALILFAGIAAATAGTADSPQGNSEGALATWWHGKYFTGEWFGAREALSDRGIDLRGKWVGVYYGVVDSERGARGFFDQEITFDGEVDVAKLTGAESVRGLSAFGGVRWRDPRGASNPNTFVEGNPMFNPGRYQSGTQWRFTHFGLAYATPEVFGIKNFLSVKGGWLQPIKEFIVQPLSLLFVNNVIGSSKGLGYNMPWSSSLSTWGGVVQVRPADSAYLRGGLFMAAPRLTATGNHGLAFEGYAQDPSRNGLMVMGEAGWTPKLGTSKLPGKYAAGGYFHGVEADTFVTGSTQDGVYGFYFQADQMLYREPSPEAEPVADGKSFKSPVAAAAPLSEQGLSMFNLINFAPGDVNLITFYFQSGLVYRGAIPGRDNDQAMCAVAFGSYSGDNIHAIQSRGIENQPNFTAVLEADYRIQLNEWAYIQPYAQYVIRPSGAAAISNATVLGFMAGIAF